MDDLIDLVLYDIDPDSMTEVEKEIVELEAMIGEEGEE